MTEKFRASGTPVIVITLLLAALLEVLPLPGELDRFRPHWMTLTMIYWVLALPYRIGVMWGWFVGLFQDVLLGSLLGQHALALAVVAYLAQAGYKRIRVFPPLQQSLVVFLMVGVAAYLSYLVQQSTGRSLLSPLWVLVSALVSALLWRLVFNFLRWVRRYFLVR